MGPLGVRLPGSPWHARPWWCSGPADDAPWTDLGTTGNDATGEMENKLTIYMLKAQNDNIFNMLMMMIIIIIKA